MTTKPTLELAREFGIEVLDYEEVSTIRFIYLLNG